MRIVQAKAVPIISLLFFASLIWLPFITVGKLRAMIWYTITLTCSYFGLLFIHFKIRIIDLIFLLLIGITGFINLIVVENISFNRTIYMCISIFVALLLMNPRIQAEKIRVLLYMNSALVLLASYFLGVEHIYNDESENYVSVYAIALVCYFYTLCEYQRKRLSVFPAIITFILCLVARGRGGMLCSGFLLLGICFRVYLNHISTKLFRYIVVFLLFLFLGMVFIYFKTNINAIYEYPIFSHFASRGFESNARISMWNNYVSKAVTSTEGVLCGYNYDDIPRIAYHKGNPHSSFVDIHGFHGGITFIVIAVMIIIAYRWAWRQGKWIYLICFSVFMLRGATDRMFWGAPITPIFFLFLLLPYHWNNCLKVIKGG